MKIKVEQTNRFWIFLKKDGLENERYFNYGIPKSISLFEKEVTLRKEKIIKSFVHGDYKFYDAISKDGCKRNYAIRTRAYTDNLRFAELIDKLSERGRYACLPEEKELIKKHGIKVNGKTLVLEKRELPCQGWECSKRFVFDYVGWINKINKRKLLNQSEQPEALRNHLRKLNNISSIVHEIKFARDNMEKIKKEKEENRNHLLKYIERELKNIDERYERDCLWEERRLSKAKERIKTLKESIPT